MCWATFFGRFFSRHWGLGALFRFGETGNESFGLEQALSGILDHGGNFDAFQLAALQ